MLRYPLLLLFFILFAKSYIYAQAEDSLNVLFQDLKATSHFEETYRISLEEKLKSKLVSLHRFGLIVRDSAYWNTLRNELAIKDFLNEETAIKLGDLVGADYYLEGKFIRFITEKNPNSMFTATAEASLKLINLQTGKHLAVITSTQTGTSELPNIAIDITLQNLADNLTGQMKNRFSIIAKVNSIKEPYSVILNKGHLDGITGQQSFYSKSDKRVKLKIIETLDHQSIGRLVTGKISDLQVNDIFLESIANVENAVTVRDIQKQIVIVDGGENMGLKKGDIYIVEHPSGQKLIHGVISIKKVNYDEAEGKIITGREFIKNGTSLRESKEERYKRARFISVAYKKGLSVSLNPNKSQGIVQVTNTLGVFDVDTKYNQALSRIEDVSVISLGLGTENYIKKMTTTLRVDIFSIGELKNWTINLEALYNQPLIDRKLNFVIGGAIGYGRLKQYLPDNVIENISKGTSSYTYAYSFIGSAKTGLQMIFKQFDIVTSVSYEFIKFNDWKYSIKGGDGQEKQVSIPLSILNYSQINLGGLYGELSLRYRFQ
jgi:hypothetical protein